MSGVTNGDGGRIADFFGMDASGYYDSRAPGSRGASGRAADDVSAGPVTPPTGAWQPGARPVADTSGTVMPGQVDTSLLAPGPHVDYVDTGAGHGGTDAWPRHDWQQDAQ
jgi:hypothetical protein